jgi:hypothetical protein
LEDRGRRKSLCFLLIDGGKKGDWSNLPHSALDATSLFPGAYVVVSVNYRQGFLTPGSNARLHGLPNLRTDQ